MNGNSEVHRKAIIGNPSGSFWLYDSKAGFDISHPENPTAPRVDNAITFKTTTQPITVDPAKSALVIIDMQNFFLSTALGRSPDSKGLVAQRQLLRFAIPAARKAGIQIVWLNWGLTQDEIDQMPPAALRAFGFEVVEASQFNIFHETEDKQAAIDNHGINEGADGIVQSHKGAHTESLGKNARIYKGLGSEIGPVILDDGTSIEAGRLLMRDQWNANLTPNLLSAYHEGLTASPPDKWIHKNRMSGLWGQQTDCTTYLDQKGIKTLFFAGVNTDQCVGGSLTDAFTKGYDCILLSDGAATTSPKSSQDCYEFNSAKTYGFCTSCQALWDGVRHMF